MRNELHNPQPLHIKLTIKLNDSRSQSRLTINPKERYNLKPLTLLIALTLKLPQPIPAKAQQKLLRQHILTHPYLTLLAQPHTQKPLLTNEIEPIIQRQQPLKNLQTSKGNDGEVNPCS